MEATIASNTFPVGDNPAISSYLKDKRKVPLTIANLVFKE
jgi:hypothetical protein